MVSRRILILGYGNPGRLDDGLGPACIAALEPLALPGVTLDAAYQLNPEDADAVAAHDVVIFVDAAVGGAEPFEFRRLEPVAQAGFTTHHVPPEGVLALARDMFGATTVGYLMAICGYEFDAFAERLSPAAQRNLDAAIAFLRQWMEDGAAPIVDRSGVSTVEAESGAALCGAATASADRVSLGQDVEPGCLPGSRP